jgi:hypothetical protein
MYWHIINPRALTLEMTLLSRVWSTLAPQITNVCGPWPSIIYALSIGIMDSFTITFIIIIIIIIIIIK